MQDREGFFVKGVQKCRTHHVDSVNINFVFHEEFNNFQMAHEASDVQSREAGLQKQIDQ